MSAHYSIPYPRNVLFRRVANTVARGLLRVFARVTITGKENLPEKGPLILVGNHVEIMEVLLMAVYVPYLVEILGTGDIPLDPTFKWLIEPYGFIPINRGNMDRKGLNMALDVLKQGGVIGIFPEGGIWETSAKQARTGVAWLSQQAGAPVLPIGFGGVAGALGKMVGLHRPEMVMNIGKLMPPVQKPAAGERKTALENAANQIMAEVEKLIPESDQWRNTPPPNERFDFDVTVIRPDGTSRTLYDDFTPEERAALGKFFHRPVLLNTFARNMRLPVQPLKQYATARDAAKIANAAAAIVDYLETSNPQFFNYRFGYDEGAAMQSGLAKLRDIARRAAQAGEQVELKPTREAE